MNGFKHKHPDTHLVVICDEAGIFDAFQQTKEALSDRTYSWLSLIYAFPGGNHAILFDQELRILEKRFLESLQIYRINSTSVNVAIRQDLVEAIINSNILKELSFEIFGTPDFSLRIFEMLIFLGISPSLIQTNPSNK
jgi:hypothetical protein